MSNLAVKGKVKVCGMEIPNVYGGFGEDQKVILAKTVAELHDKKLSHVNELINNNIKHFDYGVDIIDLKSSSDAAIVLTDSKIFTNKAINASKNIYLLSERGYSLLLKFMDGELAIKQYKLIIDEYFTIKESIQYLTQEELKQLIAREDGIIRRNRETAAISKMIHRGDLSGMKNPYGALTNTTYDILYGMYAKEIKKYLDLRQQDNLRDYLSSRNLEEIREIEDEICWMVKKDYTWKEIYKDLLKEYPDKTKPVKADKSIKQIKKSKKIAIKEKDIKMII